jgi:galactokinase/mevalonate kinase-like predicted kinase
LVMATVRSYAALLQGDLARFAELMNEHWQLKKKRSGDMSNRRTTSGTKQQCAMVRLVAS